MIRGGTRYEGIRARNDQSTKQKKAAGKNPSRFFYLPRIEFKLLAEFERAYSRVTAPKLSSSAGRRLVSE